MSNTPLSVIPVAVRRSEIWSRLVDVLSEYDVKTQVGRSKKHWFLEIEVGHTPRRHYFSAHVRDPRSVANNVASLRRVVVTARTNIVRQT